MEKFSKGFSAIFLIIGICVLLLAGGYFYFMKSGSLPTNNGLSTNISPKNPVSEDVVKDQEVSTLFISDREIWQLKNGEVKKVTETGSTIYRADIIDNKNLIVFTTGKQVNRNGFINVEEPDTVYVQVVGGPSEKIFELEFKVIDQDFDYRLQIRDLGLSDDGKFVAITTSDSLYVYDLSNKQLKKVFTNVVQINKGMVYSYFNPIFSPNNSQMILSRGYYEGSDQVMVNLTDGSIKELGYHAYVLGEKVFSWVSDNEILVSEYNDVTSPNNTSKLKIVILPDQKDKQVYDFDGTVQPEIVEEAIFIKSTVSKPAGTTREGYPLTDTYDEIIKLDLKSGERTTFYTIKTTGASKGLRGFKVDGDKMLIDVYDSEKESDKGKVTGYSIYSLDLKVNNPELKLVLENASLEVMDY